MSLKAAARKFLSSNPKTNFIIKRNDIKAGTLIGIDVESENCIRVISKTVTPISGDVIENLSGKSCIVESVNDNNNYVEIFYSV